MLERLNRSIEFRGLAEKQGTTEKSWFYYGVGTKPWLVGYVWVSDHHRQFIGKNDYHDKKIYEGDVLSDNLSITGVVLFVDSEFVIMSENKDAFSISGLYTVIGNVDEHDYLRRKFQHVL